MKAAEKNCETLINHLLSFSLNLVRFKGRKQFSEPCGLTSGFSVTRDCRTYLLSAGHSMRRKSTWFWETNVILQEARETLCIPVGPFTLLKSIKLRPENKSKSSNIDFAWTDFDLDSLKRRFKEDNKLKGHQLELNFYNGPLDCIPILHDEPYTFAAWNRGTLVPLGSLFLKREAAYETSLQYTGKNRSGNYVFKLARPHMGHEYYRGASGAPISSPEGKIVSMVLGGNMKTNEIYGLPLAAYSHLLSLG